MGEYRYTFRMRQFLVKIRDYYRRYGPHVSLSEFTKRIAHSIGWTIIAFQPSKIRTFRVKAGCTLSWHCPDTAQREQGQVERIWPPFRRKRRSPRKVMLNFLRLIMQFSETSLQGTVVLSIGSCELLLLRVVSSGSSLCFSTRLHPASDMAVVMEART